MNYVLEIGSKSHKFSDDAITFKSTQSSFAMTPDGGGSAFSFRLEEKDYTPEREKMLSDVYDFLNKNRDSKNETVTIKYYSPSMKKYIVIGNPKNRIVENESRLDTSKDGSNGLIFILTISG